MANTAKKGKAEVKQLRGNFFKIATDLNTTYHEGNGWRVTNANFNTVIVERSTTQAEGDTDEKEEDNAVSDEAKVATTSAKDEPEKAETKSTSTRKRTTTKK